ncbi:MULTISPECIES: AAA family ATPase [Anaerococcus]|jgi:hypothetical protein|uniref:Uncharacterized protein n=1 Tax=Anaerococcus octavius TaxID=54007 RepID=A0A2I1M9D8_9FIRM|nr:MULTISPECIES: AAA family ATPase [Anaerococcus]MDU7412315.1 AAA family ATPase [Anaerococcus sp.]PKZ16763.1 hypothetical protein CYJ34_02975 [Anaerococcus octavius]
MTDINWDIFRTKFHGKEREEFENLSYLLFCDEYSQDIGILQYKNQIGIETEPIDYEEKLIGFQAKFYDTSLSSNKIDIMDSITKAKEKNKDLDVILLYTNKDLSENRKREEKKPKYQIEIENHAKELGIELKWRITSHFKAQLSKNHNILMRERFFSLEPNFFNLVQSLQSHTLNVLNTVKSEIIFNENVIKLNRKEEIKHLKESLSNSKITILAGHSGVGKTAVIKDLYNEISDECILLIFRQIDFVRVNNINRLVSAYGNFTMKQFNNIFNNVDDKCIVIDSSEKLFELESLEVFNEFLSTFIKNSWKVIFTVRKDYLEDLENIILSKHTNIESNVETIFINELTEDSIIEISDDNDIKLPSDSNLLNLIKNPFYFSEYLNLHNVINNDIYLNEFKKEIWDNQIKKIEYRKNGFSRRREKQFLDLAYSIATFTKIEIVDEEVIESLKLDGIIGDISYGQYYITHDIYEELALIKIVDNKFKTSINNTEFFKSLSNCQSIRRAFRKWLLDISVYDCEEYELLINDCLYNNDIEKFWKEDILISILLSDYSDKFFEEYERSILQNMPIIIEKIIFHLRVACKEIDKERSNLLNLESEKNYSYYLKPKGPGWSSVIKFIHKNKNNIDIKLLPSVASLLLEWNAYRHIGETARYSSELALFFYQKSTYNGNHRWKIDDDTKFKIIHTLMLGSGEIKDELELIFKRFIARNDPVYQDVDFELINNILTSFEYNSEVIKYFPDYIFKLANVVWLGSEKDTLDFNNKYTSIEEDFGINKDTSHYYFPPSSYQTPVYKLLKLYPGRTINFVLDFINKCVDNCIESVLNQEVEKIEIVIDENSKIIQYASGRLWYMFVGGSNSTYLLESMHMALEKYLIEYAKIATNTEIECLLIYLLKNSKSASITAVVSSVVMAYPDKLFNVAIILFSTKEIFFYDDQRLKHFNRIVHMSNTFFGDIYKNDIFRIERNESHKDIHRNRTLKQLILEYQLIQTDGINNSEFQDRKIKIWNILDRYHEDLINNKISVWNFYLLKMDTRKLDIVSESTENGEILKLTPILEQDHLEYRNNLIENLKSEYWYDRLFLWAYDRLENIESYSEYKEYEDNPRNALTDIQKLIKENYSYQLHITYYKSPLSVCYVLIRDFYKELTTGEIYLCKKIITDCVFNLFENNKFDIVSKDALYMIITSLIHLINNYELEITELKSIKKVILFLLISNESNIHEHYNISVLADLWNENFKEANSIWLGYLYLKPKYNELYLEQIRELGLKFNQKNLIKELESRYKSEIFIIISNNMIYDNIDLIANLDYKTLVIAYNLLPLDLIDDTHIEFFEQIISIFSKEIFEVNDDKMNRSFKIELKIIFLNKFCNWILKSNDIDYKKYIKPFKDNFNISEDTYIFFDCFITAQINVKRYDNFWKIWYYFYDNMVDISKMKKNNLYIDKIIKTYLFNMNSFVLNYDSIFKSKDINFFRNVSRDMGKSPATLYSISKLLYYSHKFRGEEIKILVNIIKDNKDFLKGKLIEGTLFFMNMVTSRYISNNKYELENNIRTKIEVMTILDFLVENGSDEAYVLRNQIV